MEHQRAMRFSAFISLILVCSSSMSMSAHSSEQRILLSFDNSGHQISRIIRSEPDQSSFHAEKNRLLQKHDRSDIDDLVSHLPQGLALLVWLDDEGFSHARKYEHDPRVSHAPSHINGLEGSRAGSVTGAWLISGPASATTIRIFLASNPMLGLAAEQWQISLMDQ